MINVLAGVTYNNGGLTISGTVTFLIIIVVILFLMRRH